MKRPQEGNVWLRAIIIAGGLLAVVFTIGGWCWSVSYRLGEVEKKLVSVEGKMDKLLHANGIKIAKGDR
jgi:hypothetical protein